MGAPPRISVLLPVRDGAPFLQEALTSLSAQTLDDFEVIVIDDGSSDDTPAILEAHARRDSRFRVRRLPPSGIVPALETARAEARGEFLARMDADDVCEAGRLDAQRRLLEGTPSLVGCGCGVSYFPDDVVRDGARRYQRWLNGLVTPEQIERDLFVECPLAHPTFFLRTEAVAAAGGYRMMGWPEDYDLVLRLWRRGGRFGNVPDVLLRWRERSGRLSRVHDDYSGEAFQACKAHHLRRTRLQSRPAVVWGSGPVGKGFARALQAKGVSVVAFVDVDPRKIGQNIHGAPVLDSAAGISLGRGPLHLAAVGNPVSRARIRGLLEGAGWTEPEDFFAVA